jgi:hypothetical protein
MIVVLHPLQIFSVSLMKLKLKDHHFDILEMIEVESQGKLSTVTKHGFLDKVKLPL